MAMHFMRFTQQQRSVTYVMCSAARVLGKCCMLGGKGSPRQVLYTQVTNEF